MQGQAPGDAMTLPQWVLLLFPVPFLAVVGFYVYVIIQAIEENS